jgi:hypothetical protein
MPYEIRKGGGSCGPSQWAVVKKADGKSVGCHSTRKSALKQLAALQINVMSKESAMSHQVFETATISEAAVAEAKKTGKMLIQFISPGWGSSGYYSPEVLAEAAEENVIPAGTHMYADHPTKAEAIERPGRSIKDLMAIVQENARINADGALEGTVQIVPAWQPFVETVAEHIGVSILGDAKDITMGEAEGRTGKIIEGLAHVASVDFVTRAGRGGKVLATAVESAAANQRAIDHGFAEATVNDMREQLDGLLKETYGGEKVWVYVRDFDDSTVWFCVNTPDSEAMFAQPYTFDASEMASLDGDRTEVRVVTTYVPVKAAAEGELLSLGDVFTRLLEAQPLEAGTFTGDAIATWINEACAAAGISTDVPVNPAGRTTQSQEDTMGKIQIEESEHSALVEKAGRVPTLESERDTEKARADVAEGKLAERDRRDAAIKIIGEADVTFGPLEVKGLLAGLPVKEGTEELDSEAFTTTVTTEAAKVKEARGAGRVTGFGGGGGGGEDDLAESEIDNVIGGAFGRVQEG